MRPRSIRGRLTLLSVVCALVILIPMAAVMSTVISQMFADVAWHDTQQQAILIAAAIRGGSLPHVVTPTVPGVDLVQVVAPDGRVLAASPAARNKPPISVARPAPNDPLLDLQTCSNAEPGCLRYSALRVDPRADSPIVLAARRTSTTLSTGFVDAIVAAQATVLVSCVAGLTWAVTGRILQPVNAIRSELAKITFSDLSHRIAEPAGDDEICRLIRTLNQTLLRLETATHQQRRFVADASHELRTPVAGLRVKLEEAQMHPRDIDVNGLVEHTLNDVLRLQAILADMLMLASLESSAERKRQRVDLAALTRAELKGRAHTPPIRSSLEDGVTVAGVPSQLSRMLTNLLDNAQRHARHVVDIEVHRDSDSALVTVCDDGPGIAEADRERIFERFTRLDTARSRGHGGTGLGLAIVSDVVHAHAGTILVGESVHGGSRFDVRFPLLTDAP
ncbi:HAMP domain-containing sensor histidine kinase [Acrocarpospora macrocephala]|uniref:histidine kinase n=1 Tax=Acrocarpospora macrocephala TaxID=150177 RepID=A0A5M3WSC4_9ACTN|nr:two-component sensor histidine kinase [Acrocarpospora macrocephala]